LSYLVLVVEVEIFRIPSDDSGTEMATRDSVAADAKEILDYWM
jgi:hypothetical protein